MPQHCPTPRELDDLELLLSGALSPRTTFDDEITLALPGDLAQEPTVELVDPEGLPLALREREGGLTALSAPSHGPFRRLHLSPQQAAERYADRLVVVVTGPCSEAHLDLIRTDADGGSVVVLALIGRGTPQGVTSVGLVRASLAAAQLLREQGVPTEVIACPLADHGDTLLDARLRAEVALRYAASGRVLTLPPADADDALPPSVARIVDQDQPGVESRGLVILFTGLSGSGKSTLAQALHDVILEDGRRSVTSLDGDVVRRNLSAGLGFSRADRETNIRRIGWVAAEISRHGGIAICSPIAPFDSTRQQVRAMVEDAGGLFLLVHVATPLEECERRDRKGLYAKARAGEIPDFTGISSPYDEPLDAAVRIDTTGRSIEDCLDDLLPHLPSPRT